ncbi:hypothetical protein ANN_04913 [Periplaneta americana]|uniref:Uncharacterized protein n=1 Tax=Periplaneta americana TaxID=6978 RepID=A0ABQ8T9N9_PERAM|nr:hypothetical protein ANN_04913 [Periplaneta americana]
MAGLCEGGNEPPGSLKASKTLISTSMLRKKNALFLVVVPQIYTSNVSVRQAGAGEGGLPLIQHVPKSAYVDSMWSEVRFQPWTMKEIYLPSTELGVRPFSYDCLCGGPVPC